MARRSPTPAHLWALCLSPLVALLLVGWCRRALAELPPWEEAPPELALEVAAAAAVADLWGAFDRERGARQATLADLGAWLDGRGLPAGAHLSLIAPGTPTGALYVARADVAEGISLAVVEPSGAARPRWPALWHATKAPFEGAGHVLVGRDVSCTVCHITLRGAPGAPGTGPAPAQSPVSARALVLGDLVLRADARVAVHGTLHLGGGLFDAAGAPLAPELAPNLTFSPLARNAAGWAPAPGPLAPLEALDRVRLSNVAGTLLGRCRGEAQRSRRPLPAALPGFADMRPRGAGATRARTPDGAGLSGGRGGPIPLSGALDPADCGAPLVALRSAPGHLWAIGTPAEPLVLDGDFCARGDLVVGGHLRGTGTLRAERDIWVVGSLRVDGHLALVAGRDLVAGAAHEHGALARFVREAAPRVVHEPDWIDAARLGRMGQRDVGPLALEALACAARDLVVVAPRGAGAVHVRGGLLGDTVAVHAPGELTLEHDPRAHALLELQAPLGLELRRIRRIGAHMPLSRSYGLDWSPDGLSEVGPNPALR